MMTWFYSASAAATLLLFFSPSLVDLDHHRPPQLPGVSIERPVLEVTPAPLSVHSATYGDDVQNTLRCARVAIYGISRLNLLSYASSFHISVAPSAAIPERLHSQVQVCLHRDNSLGWCECQKDEWKSVQKGIWSADMSPYDKRYADVRINGQTSVSVTIALEEDIQNLCLISLVLGLALLLAPIISSRVPCCHSSSMAIVIFPVIIILLFQVAIVVILSIILAGAALGDRIVRKFVFPKQDGTKHAGVAKFVILKWGMRIIGSAFIFQSTTDPPLANGALVSFAAAYLIIKCIHTWHEGSVNGNPLQQWKRGIDGSDSFMEGHVYFSSFYNNRKRLTENDRVESTRKFTDQALADLIASPAFSAWFIANADRIRVDPHEPAKNLNKLRALKELSSMAMAYWRRVINLSMSKTNTLIGIITDRAIWSGG
ncbi:hypothetical protein HN51_041060 [Arachis hypogaea]|nr:uncharacterized protein LOC112754784 [Arachis hypogaea]QHN86755.1 hypothetical protein DS421_16g548990 [Arachis hypogaea]